MARYENTSPERVELVFFYESELGPLIYSWRSKSVEPFFEQVRRVRHRPSPGERRVTRRRCSSFYRSCYQTMVYHNHLTGSPPRALKHMLGSRDILGEQ